MFAQVTQQVSNLFQFSRRIHVTGRSRLSIPFICLSVLALAIVILECTLHGNFVEAKHHRHAAKSATRADDQDELLHRAFQLLKEANIDLNHTQTYWLDHFRVGKHIISRRFERRRLYLTQQFQRQSSQRGILIVAGGRDMMLNAAITITVLRRELRCNLPVEVVYYGQHEMDSQAANIIRGLNSSTAPVYIMDGLTSPMTQKLRHHRNITIKGFAAKVHALCYVSRHRQVLLLDADSMPLLPPEQLFSEPQYLAKGNLFWPDFWHSAWIKPEAYTQHGIQPPWQGDDAHRLTDSGQVLMDRLRHLDVLEWLWFLNSHQEVVYSSMHGDKDTYKLAFHLANKSADFQQVPVRARDAMQEVPGHEFRFHHLGMFQSLANGQPAIFHRTSFNSKWFPDCARQQPGYCHVRWLSVPLEDHQAAKSLKPHMYAFTEHEVDNKLYLSKCRERGGGSGVPEHKCNFGAAAQQVPVPVVPVSFFGPGVERVLNASYAVYGDVLKLVGQNQ